MLAGVGGATLVQCFFHPGMLALCKNDGDDANSPGTGGGNNHFSEAWSAVLKACGIAPGAINTQEIGLAAMSGVCSGYASVKIGKSIAFVVGCGFLILQGLSYAGYIDIGWEQIEKDTIKALDADGDGKLSGKDAEVGLISFTPE
jgi:uncharacterized membrane protein (Fun14 family)